jgi:hypothetical protein
MLERAMVTFILLNGAAGLLAVLIARTTPAGDGRGAVALATLSAYLLVVHSTVLASGLAGRLTPAGAFVLFAAALFAAAGLARRPGRAARGQASHPALEPPPSAGADEPAPGGRPPLTVAEMYAVAAAVSAGAVRAWPHLWDATRLWIWDDYTYHMVYPALWLREGTLAAVSPAQSFTMQAWYPLGASLVAAWFMLPFHGVRGDALAWVSLTGVLYAAIIACGAAALLSRLGCRPGAWAVPVLLLVTSRRIGVMASSFSDADLAMAATLFAGFAFAVPRGAADTGRGERADAWYAALLTGLAIGIKVSAAVPALVVLAMAIARAASAPAERAAAGRRGDAEPRDRDRSASRAARMRRTAVTASIFAASWSLTGGYWYARNALHTGNPLYPAALLFWPGSDFPDTTLREYARQYGLARTAADALVVYLDWPRFHALAAATALLGLAGWLLRRRSGATRWQAHFGLGALAITAAMLVALPGLPYSAGNAMTFRSGFIHWDSMRYVALLPVLGWVAAGFLLDGGASRWRAIAMVAIVSVALLTSDDPLLRRPTWLLALAAAAVVGAALGRAAGSAAGGRVRSAAGRAVGSVLGRALESATGGAIGSEAARGQRRHVPRLRRRLHGALALRVRHPGARVGQRRAGSTFSGSVAPRQSPPTPRHGRSGAAMAILLAALVLWRHDAKSAATAAAIHREPLLGGAAAALDRHPAGTRVAVFGDQWVFPSFGALGHLTPVRLDGDGRVATGLIGDAMQPGPLTSDPQAFVANLRAARVGLVVVLHLPHPGRSPERPGQEAALKNAIGVRLAYRNDAVTVWTIEGVTSAR